MTNDRTEILGRIEADDKFLLTTHENPDGDAIGSLVGMNEALRSLGKDSVMFMPAEQFPLPPECRELLPADQAIHEVPADLADRTVIYLDCGAFTRMDVPQLRDGGRTLINVDHHDDNPGFGDLNLVEANRSSTAELVFSIAVDLGVTISERMAEALYVGLVTDTGRFMQENTGPEAHEMAAALIRRGVDVAAQNRRIYEDTPVGKVQLKVRALSTLQVFDDGVLAVVNLTRSDYEETCSEEGWTEGIVDEVRAIHGTAVGVLFRELVANGQEHLAKISLRSSDERVNVAEIANRLGGGGHIRAAGATTELSLEGAIEVIREGVREQLAAVA